MNNIIYYTRLHKNAVIAQVVERNIGSVEVTSSTLVNSLVKISLK